MFFVRAMSWPAAYQRQMANASARWDDGASSASWVQLDEASSAELLLEIYLCQPYLNGIQERLTSQQSRLINKQQAINHKLTKLRQQRKLRHRRLQRPCLLVKRLL